MTIKNKDGTTYKLKGPNKLAITQDFWSDFEVHNMDWDNIHLPDKAELKQFNSSIPEVREAAVADPEPAPELEKVVREPAKPAIKNAVKMWCLPAVIRDRKDELYDQVYRTIEYLEKTTFDAIILNNDGLTMTFWTNVDIAKRGSIIYPSLDSEGHDLDEHRWWKVEKIIGPDEEPRLKDSGGLIHHCMPSEFTPDFS
jgi:hypothetical protein